MLSLRKLNYNRRSKNRGISETLTETETYQDMFSRVGNNIVFHVNIHTLEDVGYYLSMNVDDARKLRDQLNELVDTKISTKS